jgi:hypothetical protein
VRFLLYADRTLIDANIPTFAALRERLRPLVRGRPSGLSDLHVLVFDTGDDSYLGRRNVLVWDGEPVLVRPARESPAPEVRLRV